MPWRQGGQATISTPGQWPKGRSRISSRATLAAVYDIAVKLRDEGPMAEAAFVESFKKHPLNDVHTFAGFDAIRAAEEAFLPAEHLEKYADSIGHQPQQHKART